jgi:hypothetical protein
MPVKVATNYTNFSRGKLDHSLSGRNDLPIQKTGLEICRNFWTNFYGNLIFRPGLLNEFEYLNCAFVEFKFNKTQSYLCVFSNLKVRFLSEAEDGSFGWVLDGSSAILEVTTPYTLEQAKEIGYAQNADVMYIVHRSHAPRKLVRASATSFTLNTFSRTDDPFDNPSGGSTGYPGAVAFYQGGLYYASATLKTTTIWRSKLGEYDVFTTGSDDDDAIIFTIAELAEQIEWLYPGSNSLIAGSAQGNVAINGGSPGEPITPSTVTATITNTEGCDTTKPILKDRMIFYIGLEGRNLYAFSYDLLSETFVAQDGNFASYDITEGTIKRLVHKKDKHDLLFMMRGDGALVSFNFNKEENVAGWHEHITDGEVVEIGGLTRSDGNRELFCCVLRDGKYYIEKLADLPTFKIRDEFFSADADSTQAELKEARARDDEAYVRYNAERLKECAFLDASAIYNDLKSNEITYNPTTSVITCSGSVFVSGSVGKRIEYRTETGYEKGLFEITEYISGASVKVDTLTAPSVNTYSDWYLSFNALSALDWLAEKEVAVVADGGFIGYFDVTSSGTVALGRECSSVCFGLPYEGFAKTFNLGFQVQGVDTQTTMKGAYRAWFRFVHSAGCKFGTSQYRMERIQDYNPELGLYNLPPVPIDGTKDVLLSDDFSIDKSLYFKQDLPLPCLLTALWTEIKYGMGI